MSKKKRTRLLTNRDFPENDTAFEYIEMEEINGRQYLYQRMGEKRIESEEDGSKTTYRVISGEGCFPISVDLVQERFRELGREYISTGKEVAKTVQDLMNHDKLKQDPSNDARMPLQAPRKPAGEFSGGESWGSTSQDKTR